MAKKEEKKISFNSPFVKNNEAMRTLNRLILQKVLSSDSVKYLRESSLDRVNKLFLSEDASVHELNLNFVVNDPDGKRDHYKASTCDMSLSWEKKEEWVDSSGSLWVTCELDLKFAINSGWSLEPTLFEEKIDILNAVSDLRSEIAALVPSRVKITVLDNEERLKREDILYREAFSDRARETFKKWRDTWVGLRKNGSPRMLSRSEYAAWLDGVKPGIYEVTHNVGSSCTPRLRTFFVTIPSDPTKPAWINRKQ